jgi:hypothetical protein
MPISAGHSLIKPMTYTKIKTIINIKKVLLMRVKPEVLQSLMDINNSIGDDKAKRKVSIPNKASKGS